MTTKFQKKGNDLFLIIPQAIAKKAKLSVGMEAEIQYEERKIIIIPKKTLPLKT